MCCCKQVYAGSHRWMESLTVLLSCRESGDSPQFHVLGNWFFDWRKRVFSMRHLYQATTVNTCKADFIQADIFITHLCLTSINWILYFWKRNRNDYTILKLFKMVRSRWFFSTTLVYIISFYSFLTRRNLQKEGQRSSLIPKFKIKGNWDINS